LALVNSYTDEQLAELVRSGDEPAFTALYDRYWKKLLLKGYLLLGSTEDAEELVHDIFVTLWKKRERVVIRETFHGYISAMLQYAAFKILAERKRKWELRSSLELPEVADHSTQQWLDFEYLRSELETAIRQLPDKCRLVFELSRKEGLSDQEIAKQMEISINTVKTQKRRALEKLKTSLNSFFFF